MTKETMFLVVTLLILLLALLQFLLARGPQTERVKALEQRLEEAERRLEGIARFLPG